EAAMKILVVDDSSVVRLLLREILESDGHEVVEAADGIEALVVLASMRPDLITMDVHMPGMDGYETARRILSKYPIPIIVVTASADPRAAVTAMRALEAGALAVVDKPESPTAPGFDSCVEHLLETIRRMSGLQVAAKPYEIVATSPRPDEELPVPSSVDIDAVAGRSIRLVAIGASAGGPVALRIVLQALRIPQPWAFVVAQHIAPGFIESLSEWLQSVSKIKPVVATDGIEPLANHLYLAPDGFHLEFHPDGRLRLTPVGSGELVCPSINRMFNSVAACYRNRTIGIQLSGMGRDGADGFAALASAGAL